MRSLLNVLDVVTGERRVVARFDRVAEAPNWSPDGSYLLLNSEGNLLKYRFSDGSVTPVPIAGDLRCNNDHCIFPGGDRFAVSASSPSLGGGSRVWILPASGGAPELVTQLAPSYLHGISPDGSALAYCAERNGEFDVYTIPASGGSETRLTTAPGLDDGPEYAPDGTIWFNSVRSGNMQIYRMDPDGSAQEQMTFDSCRNWFPHVSPDGSLVVYLAYLPEEVEPDKHPADKTVTLRLMKSDGTPLRDLLTTDPAAGESGGQGTINVNSWSPDSRRIAFFTYERE